MKRKIKMMVCAAMLITLSGMIMGCGDKKTASEKETQNLESQQEQTPQPESQTETKTPEVSNDADSGESDQAETIETEAPEEGSNVEKTTEPTENTEVQSGQQITTGAFSINIPASWSGKFTSNELDNVLRINYSEGFTIEGQDDVTYPEMFLIKSYSDRESMEVERGMMDDFRELGEKDGMIYAAGQPTDTPAEYYTEEQNSEMNSMRSEISSILDTFVFLGN